MKLIDFQGLPNPEAAHQSATISSTAVTLAASITLHANTRFVRLAAENDDLRVVVHGTVAPTTTVGEKLIDGSTRLLTRAEAESCKMIRNASDVLIQVTQYIN